MKFVVWVVTNYLQSKNLYDLLLDSKNEMDVSEEYDSSSSSSNSDYSSEMIIEVRPSAVELVNRIKAGTIANEK